MARIEAIALDVDGTLLDPNHIITARVRQSIQQQRSKGLQVMLASARHIGSLVKMVGELDTEAYVIAYSGGAAARVRKDLSYELLFNSQISNEVASQVTQTALDLGLHVAWYDLDNWYAPSKEGWYAKEGSILRQSPVVVPKLEGMTFQPNKVQIVGLDSVGIFNLRAIRAGLPKTCSAVFSHDYMLEILPVGTHKADGLRKVAVYTGIGLEKIIAFGDAENDKEMLRESAIGIAMGQAPEHVKEVADWVTASNAEDGIAIAFEQEWLQKRLASTGNTGDSK